MSALIHFRLPAELPRSRIERDHIAVRRGVVDQVVIDRQCFRSRLRIRIGVCGLTAPAARVGRVWCGTAILPNKIAVAGIERLVRLHVGRLVLVRDLAELLLLRRIDQLP